MGVMEYTVKQLAKLSGVSERTIRYYDQIGLLKPQRISSSGYRIYGKKQVDQLQQILFFRELDFPLDEITKAINDPEFDRAVALLSHKQSLSLRRNRIDRLIQTIDDTITHHKEGIDMSDKQKFEGFKQKLVDQNEQQYGQETREKYGDESVDESSRKMLNLSKEDYENMQQLAAEINERLEKAVEHDVDPADEEGESIAELHKQWLLYTWSKYNAEAHKNLAQMYVDDPRFTAYYDKNVDGCAEFLRDAVRAAMK